MFYVFLSLHKFHTYFLLFSILSMHSKLAIDISCFIIFSIWSVTTFKARPIWISYILILLANDISKNPGPENKDQFFSFMNWNPNSLAKGNFERVPLLEAHNSIFSYDIISICETNLNDSTEIPDPLISDYSFISANNSQNSSHGGVGLFYKSSLPIINRTDLSFEECIVTELKLKGKKYFSRSCIGARQPSLVVLSLTTFYKI